MFDFFSLCLNCFIDSIRAMLIEGLITLTYWSKKPSNILSSGQWIIKFLSDWWEQTLFLVLCELWTSLSLILPLIWAVALHIYDDPYSAEYSSQLSLWEPSSVLVACPANPSCAGISISFLLLTLKKWQNLLFYMPLNKTMYYLTFPWVRRVTWASLL